MSSIINKAKETFSSESRKHDTAHDSSNTGPHKSNVANKLDPRESFTWHLAKDKVNTSRLTRISITAKTQVCRGEGELYNQYSSKIGSIIGGYGKGQAQGPYESSGQGTAGSGNAPSTAGPHDKDLLNKADPRVCSLPHLELPDRPC